MSRACPVPTSCRQRMFILRGCGGQLQELSGHVGRVVQQKITAAPYESSVRSFRWSGSQQVRVGDAIDFDGYEYKIVEHWQYTSRKRHIATGQLVRFSAGICVEPAELWRYDESQDYRAHPQAAQLRGTALVHLVHQRSQQIFGTDSIEWVEYWQIFVEPSWAERISELFFFRVGQRDYYIQAIRQLDGLAGMAYAECQLSPRPWG